MSIDVDVIIIGAGAAGIAAAMELRKTSLSYVILEARNRIGGRAYTDHETFTPVSIDLGGSWIHFYHPENPIYQHYQEYLADKQIAHIDDEETYRFVNEHGQLIPERSIKRAEAIYQQIFTTLENFAKTNDDNKDCSVEEFLKEKYRSSIELSDEVRYFLDSLLANAELYQASSFAKLSAKQWETVLKDFVDDQWVSFGYGTILEHLVQKYNLSVLLNTIVTSVDTNDPNRIAVSTKGNDTPKYCRRIIVTVPLGCLKRNTIKFEPPLPDWKRAAIDQMGFGLMNKLILQFSDSFWDSTATSIWHVSSEQRGRFLYTKCLPSPANILIILVHDAFAQELEQQTDQQILDEVMHFLRAIFPRVSVPDPIKYIFTRWNQDPFAYGSYSSYMVHASPQTVKLLAKETVEGRVQWAGEHANVDDDDEWSIGYIHSAFRSGQNAAKTIINELSTLSL